MDTLTRSQFDISQLRTLIQQALQLPDGTVLGGWLPENQLTAFITADILITRQTGVTRRDFDGTTERLTSSLETTVSLSCYGKNGVAMAMKLRTLLQSSRCLDRFKALGWGLLRFAEVRNLTATVGADAQERGQFDLTFTHNHLIDTPLEDIRQVDHLSHV